MLIFVESVSMSSAKILDAGLPLSASATLNKLIITYNSDFYVLANVYFTKKMIVYKQQPLIKYISVI